MSRVRAANYWIVAAAFSLAGSAVLAGRLLAASPPPALTRVSIFAPAGETNAPSGPIPGDPGAGIACSEDGQVIAFQSAASNLTPRDTNGETDIFVRDLRTGAVARVSVSSLGAQANGSNSSPSISANGQIVAFLSAATNLVSQDQNRSPDVFVHDRSTGITERVSLKGQKEVNAPSFAPAISGDGRFVAWHSTGAFSASDGNKAADIYLRDRETGVTERVSLSNTGKEARGGGSVFPSVSFDGSRVAFHSSANNLVPQDSNKQTDVFVRDRAEGETLLLSVSVTDSPANGDSRFAAISANGAFIAFASDAGNLVPGPSPAATQVYVREVNKDFDTLVRVSRSPNAVAANGISTRPRISADGGVVAFDSAASNLVAGDGNATVDVFAGIRPFSDIYRMSAGVDWRETSRPSFGGTISGDGRLIAFASDAATLVKPDLNKVADVFARNLDLGLTPLAPDALAAVPVSQSEIRLDWLDGSANALGHLIERDSGLGFIQVSAVPAAARSFLDGGLAPDTDHVYRVRGLNGIGASDFSNRSGARTLPLLPTAPGGLSVSAVGASEARLTWTDTSSNEEGFRLERQVDSAAFSLLAIVPSNNTSFIDRSAVHGAKLSYRLQAFNRGGASAFVSGLLTAALPAPSGLRARGISSASVELTWTDNANGEASYRVDRQGTSGFVEIASVGPNLTTFRDGGQAAESTFRYRVRAFRNTSSAPSNEAAIRLLAAPTGAIATAQSSSQIMLQWTDRSGAEDGYRIERRQGTGAFAVVGEAGANFTAYIDRGLAPDTAFAYRLSAFHATAVSSRSAEAAATTPPTNARPTAPTNLAARVLPDGAVELTWQHTGLGTTFRIQRKAELGDYAQIATLPITARSYVDRTRSPNTRFTYRMRAVSSDGASLFTAEVTVPGF